MRLYQSDGSLPPLPIPALTDTSAALKQMIRPLLDERARKKTEQAIDCFVAEDGAGPQLQRLLLRWRQELGGNRSWLRPIWDDSYLQHRGELPVRMNYCFELTTGRWGQDGLPELLSALARQVQLLNEERLPVETFGAGPLSMDAMQTMFYTRIPGKKKDTLFFPSLAAPLTAAVVCRGHWYILALTEGGETISPGGIRQALDAIRRSAGERAQAPGVGSFTAQQRARAADTREALMNNPLNRTSLAAIEQAVFAVCLDEPDGAENRFLSALLCGNPENRWFDKSIQLIGGGTNRIGVNLEHAGCDATAWIHLLTCADRWLADRPAWDGGTAAAAPVRPLRWNLSDAAAQLLNTAAGECRMFAAGVALAEKKITCISKETIKLKKCSPDAVAQLLFQTAYYQLTGQIRSAYEAVSTRGYYQGRTECARPVTEESVAFVRAMAAGAGTREARRELFRRAEKAHVRALDRARRAMGPERHLCGLQTMYRMYEASPDAESFGNAELFDSEGFLSLAHNHLSTSSITAPFIEQFAFGPVVTDGIGIGYGIQKDTFHLAVSAFPASGIDPNEYISAWEKAAEDLNVLLA